MGIPVQTEIQRLEDSLAGKAPPMLGPFATFGRLAELYLQLPEPSRYADRALVLARTGADAVGAKDPLYPKLRHFQAMAMRLSATSTPSVVAKDGEAAVIDRDAYSRSFEVAPGDAQLIAAGWGDWAWERSLWEEAAEAYSKANRALRRFLTRYVADPDERVKLLHGTYYGVRSAYAHAILENPREAVLEVERANSLHLQNHDDNWMIQRLTAEHPAIAARLKEAILAANSFVKSSRDAFGLDSLGRLSPEATATGVKVDEITREIRGLQGFSSFGLPADWSDVVAAAARAPLVYLVLTDKGLALVGIKKGEGDQVKFALRTAKVTTREIADAALPFFKAEFDTGNHAIAIETLMPLLEWLGHRVTAAIYLVLTKLDHIDKPVVLVPTGLLALLPLHAGCVSKPEIHLLRFPIHPRNVTYSYWARRLAHSLRRQAEHVNNGALVINNPKPLPALFDPLALADFETEAVLQHIPGVELKGHDATTDLVCDQLPKAALVHFCCHGTVAKELSYSGTLLLANSEILTYKHLRTSTLSVPARLVVLSACSSGVSAVGIDQILSLPALFLSAGAAAVIGTFWHADDMATMLLMMKFYSLWCDRRLDPEVALGEAQAWLMSSSADTLRKTLPPAALALEAAKALNSAPAEEIPYRHPWFWASFFLAGA